MATFSRVSRSHGDGVVIEGLDVVVSSFTQKAATIRPQAAGVVLDHVQLLADSMRQHTHSRRVEASITADTSVTPTTEGVYADAGPDARAHNQAFIARFLERGTTRHAPRPFAQPAADEVVPGFVQAIKDLS